MGMYNVSSPDAKNIREGDFIMSVNGVSGASASMTSAMRQSQYLQVRIQRPMKFSVTCAKEGEIVGLDLEYGPSNNSLLIKGINEGAVKKRAPDIMPGDRLISVNGVTGDSSTLVKAMKDNEPLELTLVRVRMPA